MATLGRVTSSPSSHHGPDEPHADVGREPLHEAIASARDERRGGISVSTLAIAAGAAAVASYIVSHVWGQGTILSAALTPVLVTLVAEFLRRPVERVSATAQRVAPIAPLHPRAAPTPGPQPPSRLPPPPTAPAFPPGPPPAPDPTQWSPVTYAEPERPAWRPRWGLILTTGLLAFAIVVGVFTIPELVLGHSITGAGGPTTYFSSGSRAPSAPTRTVTVPAPTSTTPAPPPVVTVTTPSTTQTAPQQTTPTTDTTSTVPTTPTTPTTPSVQTTPTTP